MPFPFGVIAAVSNQMARSAAPAVPWYLAGGVSAENCVAAYQPIGAANQAESYINIANPGTYNITATTPPTWNATDGWVCAAGNVRLRTGLIPVNDQTWSAVVKYTALTAIGNYDYLLVANKFTIYMQVSTLTAGFINGGAKQVAGVTGLQNGALWIAGTSGYFNDTAIVTAISASAGASSEINIPANGAGAVGVKIQAVAIYNTTITPEQIAAINDRLDVLPL